MNAIEDNVWSRAFVELGRTLPKARAVLAVSAHWYTRGTFVTANETPETIHDFGGFPEPLYEVQYPAKGDPGLAKNVVELLGTDVASTRLDWGLDHGTWSVLKHTHPAAGVPVIQLSIDGRLPVARHFEIGRTLAPLRDEGVLILGSGNIVHNLRDAFTRMQTGNSETPSWSRDFDERVIAALKGRDQSALSSMLEGDDGRRAHPTPDHYLPLLYAAGAATDDDPIFPIEGFDLGSISMRSAVFGATA